MSLALFLRAKKFQLELAKVHRPDYSLVQVDPGTTMILFCFIMALAAIILKRHILNAIRRRDLYVLCPCTQAGPGQGSSPWTFLRLHILGELSP